MRREDWTGVLFEAEQNADLKDLRSWREVGHIPVVVREGGLGLWGIHPAGNPKGKVEMYVEASVSPATGDYRTFDRIRVTRVDGASTIRAPWFSVTIIGQYGEVRIDPTAYPDNEARIAALEAAAAPLIEAALTDTGLRDRWDAAAKHMRMLDARLPVWFQERAEYEAVCTAEGFVPLADDVLEQRKFGSSYPLSPHEREKIAFDLHTRRSEFLRTDLNGYIPAPAVRPEALNKVGLWTFDILIGHRTFMRVLEAGVARAVAGLGLPPRKWPEERGIAAVVAEHAPDFVYGSETLPRILAECALLPGEDGKPSEIASWRRPVVSTSRQDLSDLLAWLDRLDPRWQARSGDYGGCVIQISDLGVPAPAGGAALFSDGLWDGIPRPADDHVLRAAQEAATALGVAFSPVLAGEPRQVLATAALAASSGGYGATLRVLDASGVIWSSDGAVDHPALPARPFARNDGGNPPHGEIAKSLARAACAWANGGEPPPCPEYPEPPPAISGFFYKPIRVGEFITRDRHRYRITRVRMMSADREEISYFADPLADRVWTWAAVLAA